MDFAAMLRTHVSTGADATIAAKPVYAHEASGLGIMRVDTSGRVTGFVEKPKHESQIAEVRMDPGWIDGHGVASGGRDCLANMGIYIFGAKALTQLLNENPHQDFGREVFPHAITSHKVQTHLFDGYWEDIGTIGSFFESNLQLAQPNPPFDLNDATAPIYTRARFLPPTRVDGAKISGSLIADGGIIEPGALIENSIIGLRCRIGRDVVIRNSVLMGADYYETPDGRANDEMANRPPIGIGPGAVVEGAIVDKNCRIGPGVRIAVEPNREDGDVGEFCQVRDGILVVEKDADLPEGWHV